MADVTIPLLNDLGANVAAGDLFESADISNANASVKVTQLQILQGLTITPTTSGVFTLANSKTLTCSNTITLAGTDGTTMTFPATSATLARTDAANTFTGTQTVGALVATTVNGNTFTTGTGVLTIAAGKTLTASNTLTFAGTDSTVMTFPTTSATIARTDAANTFTGVQTMTSPSFTTSVVTGSTTLGVFNTTATTVNAFGAATTLNIGASAATVLNFGGFTSAAELRFLEPSGSGTNYSGFKQPALAASITYTLPSDAPANGDVLTSQTDGTLSWEPQSGAANAVTLASAASGAGLFIVSAGADRTATATDTITNGTITNATIGSLVAGSATMALFNTVATTINFGGVCTALNIGAAAATVLNFGGHTSAAEMRFLEPSGSGTNYFGLKAAAMAASTTYTWPTAAATVGQVLAAGAVTPNILEWITPAGGGNVTAGGTLTSGSLVIGQGTTAVAVTTTGANVVTALGVAVGSAGAFVVNGGALGSPSSAGTIPAFTLGGTIAGGGNQINNVIIGTSTPLAGTFTTLVAGSTTSLLLGTAGSAVGNIGFRNATSGTATLAPPTGALGTFTVTLPNAASTLPIFGQQITFSGPTAARTITLPDENFAVGFRGVPQNAKTGSYTLLATDNGRVVPNTTGGWTVNNSVHTAGDVITVYNDSGSSQNITAGTITTMRLAGTATTGTRALAQRGLATLYFQTASEVIVSGAGVT